MSRSRLLVLVLWAVALLGALGGGILGLANGSPFGFDPWGIMTIGAVSIGSLGALVASRRPGNAIGWMMLSMGALDGLASFGLQYGYLGMHGQRDMWGAGLLATAPYGLAVGVVFGLTISFLLLLFPDGRLPSARWFPVAIAAGAGVIAMTTGITWYVVELGPEGLFAQLTTGMLNVNEAEGGARFLNEGGHLLVFLAFPLAVASLFVRRRRGGPVERRQLRWFAYGAVIFFTSVVVPLPAPFWLWYEVAATTFLFVAIGIAILRYRLYEIDRIVSRTVAYAAVTAMLVGLYLAVVFVLQLVLPAESDLATAASTLAVAALFNPLRRRVQTLVDRRFNRSRFDAGEMVEHFSHRLRGATDVTTLGDGLADVAGSVMEPAHMSLWLRERPT